MPALPVAQLINDFIKGRFPAAVCDKCIADELGMTNRTAHPSQITAALATTSDFIRVRGVCSICDCEKLVIRAVTAPVGKQSRQA